MPTSDIFRSGLEHVVYVTTDERELQLLLWELGYRSCSDGYLLGSNKSVQVSQVELPTSQEIGRKTGVYPQSMLVMQSNGNQEGYAQAATRLIERIKRENLWFVVGGADKPYVYKAEDFFRR